MAITGPSSIGQCRDPLYSRAKSWHRKQMNESTQTQRDIYTVSRLNQAVRGLLESHFPLLWVSGEISNLARPRSGHIYFTLKDSSAQLRCAMFRGFNRHLGFQPREGMEVLVRGRVGLYPERGDYQLIVEYMEEAGEGALRRAFEALKQRLSVEGLFDEQHKQPLPEIPKRIGLITSPTGAALRDLLSVLGRRFPAAEILIYPVPVQGAGAAEALTRMVQLANTRQECDVLVLARGGGSLEDLWAFNDETLARAIHTGTIPLVAGIGHEVDFSIADFVADQRAATPSAAAELITPDQQELRLYVGQLESRLSHRFQQQIETHKKNLQWLTRSLRHPQLRLQDLAQQCDQLGLRLHRAVQAVLPQQQNRLLTVNGRLEQQAPGGRIRTHRLEVERLGHRLTELAGNQMVSRRNALSRLDHTLQALNPLKTLKRGYAIISHGPDQQILRDTRDIKAGEHFDARLAHGLLRGIVQEVDGDEN